ncbi:MAG: hypothetical protein E7590_07225 [Ruminococcaceae bacterium]|nr:hypothetical protein [Oscillospiraceae bacterium]
MKVLIDLFQKVAGVGSAHKTAFLFVSFFFAPPACKEKAAMGLSLLPHVAQTRQGTKGRAKGPFHKSAPWNPQNASSKGNGLRQAATPV